MGILVEAVFERRRTEQESVHVGGAINWPHCTLSCSPFISFYYNPYLYVRKTVEKNITKK